MTDEQKIKEIDKWRKENFQEFDECWSVIKRSNNTQTCFDNYYECANIMLDMKQTITNQIHNFIATAKKEVAKDFIQNPDGVLMAARELIYSYQQLCGTPTLTSRLDIQTKDFNNKLEELRKKYLKEGE